MELSYDPKIVTTEPQNDREFYFRDVADEDMFYLLTWIEAGGEAIKTLRERFKDAPDVDAFTEAYKKLAGNFANESIKIFGQIEPLQTSRRKKKRKR